MKDCPYCEYQKKLAQLWRHEAYKLSGHPFDWEPELMMRKWVSLTDEDEIDWEEGDSLRDLVKAIEAKLKEKNT